MTFRPLTFCTRTKIYVSVESSVVQENLRQILVDVASQSM